MTRKPFTSALLLAFAVAQGAFADDAAERPAEKGPAPADGKDAPKAPIAELRRTSIGKDVAEEKSDAKPAGSGVATATSAAAPSSSADVPKSASAVEVDAALEVAKRALKDAKGEWREAHGAALEAYKKAQQAMQEANQARREAMTALASLKSPEEREKKLAEIRSDAEAARRSALEKLESVRKTLRETAPERMTEEEKTELKKKLREGADKRREERKAAAAAERQDLEKRFGKALEEDETKREVRIHAWRLARLRHLITLAELREKPALKAKAEALLQKELERFAASTQEQPTKAESKTPAPKAPVAAATKEKAQ